MKRIMVLACPRSDLRSRQLPNGVKLLNLPCMGRVTPALLLYGMAIGWDGVLVLGRHQKTCRFNGAEDIAQVKIQQVQKILQLVGLGSARLQFDDPAPGPKGPISSIYRFLDEIERIGATPLSNRVTTDVTNEGLDSAWMLARWLAEREELEVDGSAWLEKNGLPSAEHPNHPVLEASHLPLLDLLVGDLIRPMQLSETLATAHAVLSRLGFSEVGIRIGSKKVQKPIASFSLRQDTSSDTTIDQLLRKRGGELPRPPYPTRIAFDGNKDQGELLEILGYEPLDLGPDLLPSSKLSLSASQRIQAESWLQQAEQQNASGILVAGPIALARWAIVTRQGTWRSSQLLPMLGIDLAKHALEGIPIAPRTIFQPRHERPEGKQQ